MKAFSWIWTAACLLAALIAVSRGVARGDERWREEVYLTRSAALREVFPDAKRFERATVVLGQDERQRIEKRLRRRLFEKGFVLYRGVRADGKPCGYAIITDEIGKFQPITFIVACTPKAEVKNVRVMVYRESIGSEVKRRRFLSQFLGRKTSDPMRLGREIINVAGATYSSRSITRGVKKVLRTVDELFLGPRRRTKVRWLPVRLESAPRAVSRRGPRREARFLMGSVLEITCFGDEELARGAVRAAFDEVARLEALLSTYRADSEISRANREAQDAAVRVSPDTFSCVEAALAFARRSRGSFDPTLVRDGYEAVELHREARSIRFLREGLRLDLGGIGKGFALDRAAEMLERHGVTRALLNFGGQVLALDAPPDRSGWLVTVRDPETVGDFLGYYEATRVSISTSAAYERGPHVVDPRNGKAASAVLSATVCAASATEADALSTALDVLGAGAARWLTAGVRKGAVLVVPAAGGEPLSIEGPTAPRFRRLPRSSGGESGGNSFEQER